MKKFISNVLLGLSFGSIVGSFVIYLFTDAFTGPSSRQRDVAFVGLIVASTILFFTAQLFDHYNAGEQVIPEAERNRQTEIRTSLYGIVAGVAGLFLLVIASLVS